MLTTVLELIGFASITVGCFLLSVPLGFVVGGVLVVSVGALAER